MYNNRLNREVYTGPNGEMVYVPKRIIDNLKRKTTITSLNVIAEDNELSFGKVVIEYKTKRGGNHGVMELYNIGPKQENKSS